MTAARDIDNRRAATANIMAYGHVAASYVDGAPHLKHVSLRKLYAELVDRVWAATEESSEAPRVLDLGAGEGSATLPFLILGARVTAVDSSAGQLDALRKKGERFGERLDIRCEDVSDALRAMRDEYDIVVAQTIWPGMSLRTAARPWLKAARLTVDALSYPVFRARGTPPHTPGYLTYWRLEVLRQLPPSDFRTKVERGGVGLHLDERVVEYPWLFARLPDGEGRLLDAGSALNHGFLLAHPRIRRKQVYISTLAPETFAHWRRGVSYVFEDLRDCCYRSDYFDWVACISTLEHVGMDNTMLYARDASKREHRTEDYLLVVHELRRILKPGGRLLLTMPYGRYRDHRWLQVFDEAMVSRVVEAFSPAALDACYYAYEAAGWRSVEAAQLVDAEYFDIHRERRLDADMAAAARGVACLDLTK